MFAFGGGMNFLSAWCEPE